METPKRINRHFYFERRHEVRRPFCRVVSLHCYSCGEEASGAKSGKLLIQDALTVEISTHGVCLTTPTEVPKTAVIVGIPYEEGKVRQFVDAEIVSSEQLPDGRWQYHVSFRQPLPEAELLMMGVYDSPENAL